MNEKFSDKWNSYFIKLANLIAAKSPDPSTKIGAVIVDSNKRIVSTGYNGPIQGIDDNQVPLTRPEKYDYIIHAETNAVIFAKQDLSDCRIYINGFPCSTCTKLILQSGISHICYGNVQANMCDKKDGDIVKKLCELKHVKLEKID